MSELIVIKGFGSSQLTAERNAETIGLARGEAVIGMNLRRAEDDLDTLAELIHGNEVLTHSGGLHAVDKTIHKYNVRPESVTAVAPPVPDAMMGLIYRAIRLELLLHGQKKSEQKINEDNEVLHHPYGNLRLIKRLTEFDGIKSLGRMQQLGIAACAALPDEDEMFNYRTEQVAASVQVARNRGAVIVSIAGGHNLFTDQPLETMSEVGRQYPFIESTGEGTNCVQGGTELWLPQPSYLSAA